jgi:hypothetical protein
VVIFIIDIFCHKNTISTALFQMALLKAPGPDGYNAGFFQKNWNIVGPKVYKVVLYSLNNAFIDSDLNSTLIALIPKNKNPTCFTEFHPISLCNILYKIIPSFTPPILRRWMYARFGGCTLLFVVRTYEGGPPDVRSANCTSGRTWDHRTYATF